MADGKQFSTFELTVGVIAGALVLILALAAGLQAGVVGAGESVAFYALVFIGISIGAGCLGGSLTALRRRLAE